MPVVQNKGVLLTGRNSRSIYLFRKSPPLCYTDEDNKVFENSLLSPTSAGASRFKLLGSQEIAIWKIY